MTNGTPPTLPITDKLAGRAAFEISTVAPNCPVIAVDARVLELALFSLQARAIDLEMQAAATLNNAAANDRLERAGKARAMAEENREAAKIFAATLAACNGTAVIEVRP